MREELRELLHFLKSVYVSDGRTINTCSHIDSEILKGYADTIEKILLNDVILVDRNKLEHKFENVPVAIQDNGIVTLQKDFTLHSQVRIPSFQYIGNRKNKDFQEYINEMLTNQLLEYFIDDVGVKGDSD